MHWCVWTTVGYWLPTLNFYLLLPNMDYWPTYWIHSLLPDGTVYPSTCLFFLSLLSHCLQPSFKSTKKRISTSSTLNFNSQNVFPLFWILLYFFYFLLASYWIHMWKLIFPKRFPFSFIVDKHLFDDCEVFVPFGCNGIMQILILSCSTVYIIL